MVSIFQIKYICVSVCSYSIKETMALLQARVLSGENQYNCVEFIESAPDLHHLEKDNAPFSCFLIIENLGYFALSGK